MQITDEQRDQALAIADSCARFLYASPQSGEMLENIATKHGIDDAQYRIFAITVGDAILNLVSHAELPGYLASQLNIEMKQSLQIFADLIDFLSQSPTQSLESEIAQAEDALRSISPIRTMQEDQMKLSDEPVVQSSSQADLLQHVPAAPYQVTPHL